MKRFIAITLFALFTIATNAQEVTKFLGIPVDGTRSEMVRKLKAKGFTTAYVSEEFGELLKGEFNGNMVDIMIQTNSNKVKRIIVSSDGLSETNVKIRYNNLVYQFYNNTKYIHSDSDNFIIPNDEDISYELTVNKKNYQATFFQKGENGSLDGIEYRPVGLPL